jgi:hypothetical protein
MAVERPEDPLDGVTIVDGALVDVSDATTADEADDLVDIRLSRRHPDQIAAARPLPATPAPLALRLRVASADLEADFGGREMLVANLLTAPLPPAHEALVALLADPQHADVPLYQIAQLAGSSLPQFLQVYQEAMLARARLRSLQHVSNGLPEVTKGTMELATLAEQICRACKGLGTMAKRGRWKPGATGPEIVTCTACDGVGTVRYVPKLDQQRTALELGGLIDAKGSGVQIINQQQLLAGTPAGDLVALQRAVHQILAAGPGRAPEPEP